MDIKIGFQKSFDLGSGLNFPNCFFAIGERNFPFDSVAKTDIERDQKGIIHLVPYANIEVFMADQPDNKPLPCAPLIVEITYKVWNWQQANLIDLLFEKIQENSDFFSDAQIISVTLPEGLIDGE